MPTLSMPRTAFDDPSDRTPRLRVALSGLRVLAANDAFGELVGRTRDELVGSSLLELVAPREHSAFATRLDRLVRYGRDRISAIALLPRTRPPVYCAIEACFIADVDEAVDLRVAVLRRAASAAPAAAAAAAAAVPDRAPRAPTLSRTAPQPEGAASEAQGVAPEDEAARLAPAPGDPAQPPWTMAADAPIGVASHDATDRHDADPAGPTDPTNPANPAGPDDVAGAVPASGAVAAAEPSPEPTVPESDVVDVLDQLGKAVVRLDGRRRVVAVNGPAVELLGRAVDALVGQPLEALLVLSTQAREALDAAEEALEPQSVRGGTPGGGRVVTLRWIPARAGGGYGVIEEVLPVDPTTSRLSADTLQAKLVAHDARRVLSRLSGALAEIGRRVPADLLEARAALATARTCYDEVAEAIALAFDLTKDVAKDCERLNAARVVNSAVAHLVPAADAAEVALEVAYDDGLTISAPGNWIDRIVGNLVDNGIRHAPRGGTIQVTLGREDRDRPGVRIVVADNGPGVPEAERERVFDEGYYRRPGGKGIGLFIVRHFTVALGGQVHCDERPGGGAAFHVWLPLVLDEPAADDPTEVTPHG